MLRDEFTNYMFLQRSEAADDNIDNWRFFPQDFKDRNDSGTNHRDAVEFLVHFEQGDKYITCGRDGTFRLWNSSDLKHFRTVRIHCSLTACCEYGRSVGSLLVMEGAPSIWVAGSSNNTDLTCLKHFFRAAFRFTMVAAG